MHENEERPVRLAVVSCGVYLHHKLWVSVRHEASNAEPNVAPTGLAMSIRVTTMVTQGMDSAAKSP